MPSVYRTLFLASLPFALAVREERRQAVPADFSSLPSCGQTCLITAATSGNTGCPLTDFKCLASSDTFKDSVTKCVLSSCSSTDQIAVATWAAKTSASLGTPLDLSKAAAVASPAPEKKQTPAQEKPSSDATTETKPAPAKATPVNDKPEDKPTSASSNQQPANPAAPIANDGSSAGAKDTQSSVTAAPVESTTQSNIKATTNTSTIPTAAVDSSYTASSKSDSATKAGNTTFPSNQTESETSASTLSATVNCVSLSIVAAVVSAFI